LWPFTASLNALPAANFTFFEAEIINSTRVAGFRPQAGFFSQSPSSYHASLRENVCLDFTPVPSARDNPKSDIREIGAKYYNYQRLHSAADN
jgi:hypothetical protein